MSLRIPFCVYTSNMADLRVSLLSFLFSLMCTVFQIVSPLFVRSANVLVSKSFCLWSYSNLLDSFCGIVDLTTVPVYRAASVLDKQVKPLVFVCWLNCLHVQWYYRHGMTHMWLFNCANVLTRISRVWSDCLLICIVLATRVLWPVVSFVGVQLKTRAHPCFIQWLPILLPCRYQPQCSSHWFHIWLDDDWHSSAFVIGQTPSRAIYDAMMIQLWKLFANSSQIRFC